MIIPDNIQRQHLCQLWGGGGCAPDGRILPHGGQLTRKSTVITLVDSQL
jgi:hypothetical protein